MPVWNFDAIKLLSVLTMSKNCHVSIYFFLFFWICFFLN